MDNVLQKKIHEILSDLPLKKSNSLVSLFCDADKLGYDYKREEIPFWKWAAGQKDKIDSIEVLAMHEDFIVIWAKLKSDYLRRGDERAVINKINSEYPYNLTVFSNNDDTLWDFVNVKLVKEEVDEENKDPKKRKIVRRISVSQIDRLRTASERISLIQITREKVKPIELQKLHDDAFDVEEVTKQFFENYRKIYNALQEDLRKQTGDRPWAHDYALQFLNRIMFIYFIQRKRWLGENPEFIETFWKSYKKSNQPKNTFFEKWLKVLFFEAFNRPFNYGYKHFPENIKSILSNAPYLNGGLFVENELDRNPDYDISDGRFELIFKFFQQYNFTISEDSPFDKEVAVDPEMIGKVYESLVNVSDDTDERGEAGIFYTPRTEIELMCRLSLVDNLANHLGDNYKNLLYEVIFAFDADEKESADKALSDAQLWERLYNHIKEITILDPACGSGSFLVGMLYVLDDLRVRAYKQLEKEPEDSFERKKDIIGNNLYGVDVKEWACHVAELRLWLALIIDYEASPAELHVRREPLLPYFTFKIRPGDSLVQEVGGINFSHIHESREISSTLKAKITNLKTEKLRFYLNDEEREFKTENQIKQAEKNLFRDILEAKRYNLAQEISKLRLKIEGDYGDQIDIYGTVETKTKQMELQTAEWRKEIEKCNEDIKQIENALTALNSTEKIPFVWDISFVETFKGYKKGFDIVIGNPPYVRQENIADPLLPREAIKNENKKQYKAKLAKSVYQCYPKYFKNKPVSFKLDGKSDLYIYFYFHGLSLLNTQGSFCFITSNSWLDVGYGKNLQEFLLKQCHVKIIIDNQVKRSFKEADVNTIIALFSNPNDQHEWGLDKNAKFIMLKVPFEQILDPIIFEEIEETAKRKSTEEYRINPILQKELLQDGCEVVQDDQVDKKKVQTTSVPLIKSVKYIGNKWGGKYLRAPDIYWTILEKGKFKKLEKYGKIETYLNTGGADKFYFVKQLETNRGFSKIQNIKFKDIFTIESRFLQPIIKSSQELLKIQIDKRDVKSFILVINDSVDLITKQT